VDRVKGGRRGKGRDWEELKKTMSWGKSEEGPLGLREEVEFSFGRILWSSRTGREKKKLRGGKRNRKGGKELKKEGIFP